MNLLFILGRNPELAQKEIEATATILPFQWSASILAGGLLQLKAAGEVPDGLLDKNGSVSAEFRKDLWRLQDRLGGTLRIAQLFEPVAPDELVNWTSDYLAKDAGEGKLTFGISWFGKPVGRRQIGLQIKSKLKNQGISVRAVEKPGEALSTAQVLHNKLTSKGQEIILVPQNGQVWVGKTLTLQDIDSYSKRDFQIPFPDAASGMLPPKLAQTMVNLVVRDQKEIWVYDPFCGNGRIVEESWLMGIPAAGSDIDPVKVQASEANLAWMNAEYALNLPQAPYIWQQDATSSEAPAKLLKKFPQIKNLAIVSEPYLGKPVRYALSPEHAEDWLNELKPIYANFFKSWAHHSLRPEMLIVFPAVKVMGGKEESLYPHLVDTISGFGYTSSILAWYARPDSLVRRALVQVSYR